MRRRTFGGAFIATVIVAIYWGIVASDGYVSEAHVIIQSTDLSSGQSMDFSGLLGNVGGGNGDDQLLLRDYLLSTDMLEKLDKHLDLRAHYSDTSRDPVSRMWSKDDPTEWFHEYYLSHVSIEYDSVSGVLIILAEAYDPKMAHAISSMLVEEGERYMNAIVHRLAAEQVMFLEKQVADMSERVMQARRSILDYQNEKGMASPQGAAENIGAIINGLVAKLTELQTTRSTIMSYQSKASPKIIEINQQIKAVEKQIAEEKARLVSSEGQALNVTVEEYQRLQLQAEFAQDIYKTALVALEKGRVEAVRTLKKVSVLQYPTLPQYPMQPRRIYNMIVFGILAMLFAGIIHLIAAIVRDHSD
ncbi:MAG: chain-length determining protein [Gammaproteobacteria bacterium]|nr:chain-length determining protein [Gammaproteobacteria bacterium]